MTRVHRFADSLRYSHEQADAPYWRDVYRSAFPTLASMTDVRADGWHQRAGIDRVLVLGNGTSLLIDEKVRREAWPDVLLEVWSDEARGVPGWTRKPLACDYIAYAFEPTRTAYLLPFLLLQRALDNSRHEWKAQADADANGFRWVRARNPTHVTVSIAVPTSVLLDAVRDAVVVTWTQQSL